ncbi:hypothetical protein [Glycomyces sp. NPDC048151]|uniref:hypothetical protein n=1 Tax=Glycomyces sp. NPDC048151 TaxID=3364002 RepID=UPI0037139760
MNSDRDIRFVEALRAREGSDARAAYERLLAGEEDAETGRTEALDLPQAARDLAEVLHEVEVTIQMTCGNDIEGEDAWNHYQALMEHLRARG